MSHLMHQKVYLLKIQNNLLLGTFKRHLKEINKSRKWVTLVTLFVVKVIKIFVLNEGKDDQV